MALVIEASDCTQSGSNTTSTSMSITVPDYVTGDLIIVFIGIWQDNNVTQSVTWPTGPQGETVTSIQTGYGPSAGGYDAEVIAVGWFIGTGTNSSGGWTVTANQASCRFDATVIKVPAGEFDATTPISSVDTKAHSSGTNVTTLSQPAATAGSTDGGGKLISFLCIDQDPITATPTGYTSFVTHDQGRVAIKCAGRDSAVTDSESISAVSWTGYNDAAVVYAIIVREVSADYDTVKWRIRKDDLSGESATWYAAADTNWTPAFDTTFRIRFGMTEAGGTTDTDSFKLQYRLNGGSWTDVTTSSSNIRITATGNVTDGADTSQVITSGNFVTNNNGFEDSSGTTATQSFTANYSSEMEWAVQLRSADLSCPYSLEVQVVETGAAAIASPTAWPIFGGSFADIPTSFDVLDTIDWRNSLIGGAGGAGTKINGGINIDNRAAEWTTNATPPSTTDEGYRFEFNAGGTAVDMTDEIFIVSIAYNAPNRIQIRTAANRGQVFTLMTSTVNYKDWIVGGNDTAIAYSPQHKCLLIDPAATASATGGTGLTTSSVLYWQCTNREEAISGTSNNQTFMSEAVRCSTANSGNIPRLYGPCATWETLSDAVYGSSWDTIKHNYVYPVGTAYFVGCPFSIGKSGQQTTFKDGGATIVSPASNVTFDPRFHLGTTAMRVYFSSMQSGDTAELSGTYDWGTRAAWDMDTAETITMNNPTFTGMGNITIGAGADGSATFDDTGIVILDKADSFDLDGSTFLNPNGTHLMEIG